MSNAPLKRILLCGGGLAGYICTIALSRILPPDIEITLLETPYADKTDIFFGTVTSPETYKFLLNYGLTEPELLLATNTAFSLGTHYQDWSLQRHSWIQSFHLPLPLFNGVELHHYLNREHATSQHGYSLEPYIISARVAQRGAFAHPPEERKTPLADMEYGYQFSPRQWSRFFASKIDRNRVDCISGTIETVTREGDTITSITLSNGTVLDADFVIDALGPSSLLLPKSTRLNAKRPLRGVTSVTSQEKLGKPLRTLIAKDFGWQAETPLQNGLQKLTIYDPENEGSALNAHGASDQDPIDITIDRCASPWNGNCLVLGHGAGIIEALTVAPMLLLQRDIDRLVELIPVSADMKIERREYNRRFTADYDHADMFQNALLKTVETPDTPYWTAARSGPVSDRLSHKITQFENRGISIQYDYEPFTSQDWTMLHFGMGRRPARYDTLADRISRPQIAQKLDHMQKSITMMAEKLPSHHDYMTRLIKYLKAKNGQ